MELKKYEVSAEKLRWECDPKLFDFECTKDLAPLREFIGQERATRAVEFGLNMADADSSIVPSPKPEKKVRSEASSATTGITTNSTEVLLWKE